MKVLNGIVKGSIGSFRVFYSLLALAVILAAAYILGGYAFLVKGVWGTDMGSALSTAVWVDKYFPHVPFWYPSAGGGASLMNSYPVFSFYLVALLKRLTDLDFIQAFRVLGFSSVPLMALGIYAFVALRFKNQTAALMASILYLLSPIAWVWLFDWGFYAESVSHIFVMPVIIFWDLFFTSFLDHPEKIRNRVYLILTVIFLSLALLTHFFTGLGLIMFFGFYVIGYTLKAKDRQKVFIRGILAFLLVSLLSFGLTVFSLFPFYRYAQIAAQAGVASKSYEYFKESKMTIDHILGFRSLTEEYYAARHISFPAVVSCLAMLGIFVSFRKPNLFALALFALVSVSLFFNPEFLSWVSSHAPQVLVEVLNRRPTLVLLRFILPILAALGAIEIFKIPFFWVKERRGNFAVSFFSALAGLALVIGALYWFGYLPRLGGPAFNYGSQGIDLRNIWGTTKTFCFGDGSEAECFDFKSDGCLAEKMCWGNQECLENFYSSGNQDWCHSLLKPFFLPLGVRGWCNQAEERGLILPKLCYPQQLSEAEVKSFWQECRKNQAFSGLCNLRLASLEEQLWLSRWPKLTIFGGLTSSSGERLEPILAKISAENPLARLDFSVYRGQFGMWAPYFNRDRHLSQIYIYAGATTLIRQFWVQQMGAFYLNDLVYGEGSDLINNLARWFGINYIFFDQRTNPKFFREGNWELWDGSWEEGILKFPEENSLAELTTKPTVLVVGQNKVDAYGQVFRLGLLGVFPYKDVFLVWGKDRIDDYDLAELKKFKVLLLHGYTYQDRQKTDKLLVDYVRSGGRVFIDTGWQYTTPDWETKPNLTALEIIPFNKLVWKDLGRTREFVLEEGIIVEGVDTSQFAPLAYRDQSWYVSTAEKGDFKNWAKVILGVKGYPLVVAGELGEGRIIWSGMNLFPHAKQGEETYDEEIKFLAKLFDWLTEGNSKESFSVNYTRENPDKVEFAITENLPIDGFLLWKEAYHPDFRARVVSSADRNSSTVKLETYRGGPGFVLIKVPQLKKGDRVIYEYRQPFFEKASFGISLLTFLFLLAILVEGLWLRKKSFFWQFTGFIERKLYWFIFELWKKPFGWLRKAEEE